MKLIKQSFEVNWHTPPSDIAKYIERAGRVLFFNSLVRAEKYYLELIRIGWTPQQARVVLPNALKTEIVVTANLREWRTILKQRTSNKAHPQMRDLMLPLIDYLKKVLPPFFEDINP